MRFSDKTHQHRVRQVFACSTPSRGQSCLWRALSVVISLFCTMWLLICSGPFWDLALRGQHRWHLLVPAAASLEEYNVLELTRTAHVSRRCVRWGLFQVASLRHWAPDFVVWCRSCRREIFLLPYMSYTPCFMSILTVVSRRVLWAYSTVVSHGFWWWRSSLESVPGVLGIKALQRSVFSLTDTVRVLAGECPTGSYVPATGRDRWKGAPNDSLFIEFLDLYENCLLSYE